MRTLSLLTPVALAAMLLAPLARAQEKKDPVDPKKVLAQLLKDIKQTDDVERQIQAAMGLADCGADAEPAMASLLAALGSKNEDLRLNAAIAGPRIELAKACSISATAIGNRAGHRAIDNALAMIARIAAAATARLLRTASTTAPPGT